MYCVYVKPYGSNVIHSLCKDLPLNIALNLIKIYKIAHPGAYAFIS